MKPIAEMFCNELDEISARRATVIRNAYLDETHEKALLVSRVAGNAVFQCYTKWGYRPCVVVGIEEKDGGFFVKLHDAETSRTYRVQPDALMWANVVAGDFACAPHT